jgi:hypothetical protein
MREWRLREVHPRPSATDLDEQRVPRPRTLAPSGSARECPGAGQDERLYREFAGEGGDMLSTVVVKLANPDPYDLTAVDLTEYKGIVAPWNEWRAVEAQCRSLALALLEQPSEKS